MVESSPVGEDFHGRVAAIGVVGGRGSVAVRASASGGARVGACGVREKVGTAEKAKYAKAVQPTSRAQPGTDCGRVFHRFFIPVTLNRLTGKNMEDTMR